MSKLLENLNKEQTDAVRHGAGPLLIVAGAGTGKTTVITRRIAYLIEQSLAKPDEILALTFTDKAAGEMQERADILLPLGYHDMWISTFHSFCQRILEQHGLDIGLPGDFKLLNGTQAWVLIYNNLDKFNLNYYRPLGNPNKFISALLKHFSRCKDELISPEDYLKYAEGLRLATDSVVKTKKNQIMSLRGAGTLSGDAAISSKKKIASSSAKATADRSDALAMTTREAIDESEIIRLEEIANAFHVYQKLLLDNSYLDFGDLINYTLELFKKRPKILEYYQKKFKYILVDEFQDTNFAQYQLVKLLAGNNTTPSANASTPPFQEGNAPQRSSDIHNFPPFQEQSSGQGGVPNAVGGGGRSNNLVVVGDDDQSIYKFRGASVSNILKFQEDFPGLKQITLIENYRSSQNILDLAYNFIQANNPDRLEVKLNINKRLNGQNKANGVIELLEGKDLSEELNLIAKKINELKQKNPKSTWNDFAILVRSNSAASELLPILSSNGIPHTFVANTGLYTKPLISGLIAYISLLNNFHDSLALYRVLSFEEFKIPPADLATLLTGSEKKTLSLYEVLLQAKTIIQLHQNTQKIIDKILHQLQAHAKLTQEKSANEAFVEIIQDLGLEKALEAETLENAENRELLDQFYKKIETFVAENTDKSLHNFLHLLNLEIEAGDEGQIKFDPNLGPESLKLLTIHSGKGLEFSYVFIPNMVELRFPTRARNDQIEIPKELIKDILPEGDFHLQEERRLFYVAVTRAKTHLYLSWAKDYGGAKTKRPSIFLQETKLVPGSATSQATGKVIFTQHAKKQEVYKFLPETFSFSALKTFERCPLQYKYQYYLKLPSSGSAYFSFGQTIHKVFEIFLKDFQTRQNQTQGDLFGKTSGKQAELGTLKFLEDLYEKNWIDEWYQSKKQKEEYKRKGHNLLKKFYEHTTANIPHPKYIEKSFYLPLGKYKFTGKIDRADKSDGPFDVTQGRPERSRGGGGVEIIDYKTSEKIPGKNAKHDLDQLLVYQWAAQEAWNEKVDSLCYWYLQENKFLPEPTAGPKEINELKTRLLEDIEKIIQTIKYDQFKELDGSLREHDCEFLDLQ